MIRVGQVEKEIVCFRDPLVSLGSLTSSRLWGRNLHYTSHRSGREQSVRVWDDLRFTACTSTATGYDRSVGRYESWAFVLAGDETHLGWACQVESGKMGPWGSGDGRTSLTGDPSRRGRGTPRASGS